MSHLKRFQHYLNISNYDSRTTRAYVTDIKQFLNFLVDRFFPSYPAKSIPLGEVSSPMIEDFLEYQLSGNSDKHTVRRRLSACRSFFRFFQYEGELDSNPALEVSHPYAEPWKPQTFLLREEIEELLNLPINEDSGIRDRTIMVVLYYTGIKVDELVRIGIDDVDLNTKTLKIVGKDDRERILPLNLMTVRAIGEYIVKRDVLLRHHSGKTLFLSGNGHPLQTRDIHRIVTRHARKAWPACSINPKTLQKSLIQHLLDEGLDIHNIQELVGHKTLSSLRAHELLNAERRDNRLFGTVDEARSLSRRIVGSSVDKHQKSPRRIRRTHTSAPDPLKRKNLPRLPQ